MTGMADEKTGETKCVHGLPLTDFCARCDAVLYEKKTRNAARNVLRRELLVSLVTGHGSEWGGGDVRVVLNVADSLALAAEERGWLE